MSEMIKKLEKDLEKAFKTLRPMMIEFERRLRRLEDITRTIKQLEEKQKQDEMLLPPPLRRSLMEMA